MLRKKLYALNFESQSFTGVWDDDFQFTESNASYAKTDEIPYCYKIKLRTFKTTFVPDLVYFMRCKCHLAFHIHCGKQQTSPLPCSATNHHTPCSGSILVCCPSFFSTENNVSMLYNGGNYCLTLHLGFVWERYWGKIFK